MPDLNVKLSFLLLLHALSLVMTTGYAQPMPDNDKIRTLKSQLDTATDLSRVSILNDICDQYETINVDSSLSYAQQALDLSEKTSNSIGIVKSLNNIGNYYCEDRQFEKAEEYFNRSYTLSQAIGNKQLQSHCLNFIGMLHQSLANYPQSIDFYLKSIAIREELGDSLGIGMVYGNLGYAYQNMGDFDNAEKYMSRALTISTALKDTRYTTSNHVNLGLLYLNKDMERAMNHYQAGLTLAEKTGDLEGVAVLLGNMAVIISRKGNLEEAISYLNRSLKIKEEILKKPQSITHTYNQFQMIYQQHKRYQASVDYGLKSLELLKKYPNKRLELRVLNRLSEAYASLQNNAKAYAYLQKHLLLKDSIFNEEKSLQVNQLQTIYNTNKKDLTIAKQESEIELMEASSLFNTRITWAIGIGAVLLFGSAYLYRSYRFALREKRLEKNYAHQLISAYEEERKRISRDLHDSVGQSLILIKNKVVLNQDDATVTMVSKALEEVRVISKALHPEVLEKLGLTASIRKIIKDADEATDIFFTEEITAIDGIFSKDHELQIYRITQEAINNIIKHAQTESALISVRNEKNKVTLLIQDHGVGFDITENSKAITSFGMKTLKERTQILGGKMIIDSTKGNGTSIWLELDKPLTDV